jgi:hypothetical protein
VSSDITETTDAKTAAGGELSPGVRQGLLFYRVRNRIYSGLLVFVVCAGLPVLAVPTLRHRLADRVHVLRAAMSGGYRPMLIAKIGENSAPFPSEYEHAVAHRNYPQLPPSITGAVQETPINVGQIYPQRAPKRQAKTGIDGTSPAAHATTAESKSAQEAPPEETPPEEAMPVYKQGRMEQEIYDILLKTDANVAALVQGKNTTLQFKTWDVAKRQEDVYWVRILFAQLPAKTELECIWQVQPMSKQVAPLNYNARSLPKS